MFYLRFTLYALRFLRPTSDFGLLTSFFYPFLVI